MQICSLKANHLLAVILTDYPVNEILDSVNFSTIFFKGTVLLKCFQLNHIAIEEVMNAQERFFPTGQMQYLVQEAATEDFVEAQEPCWIQSPVKGLGAIPEHDSLLLLAFSAEECSM